MGPWLQVRHRAGRKGSHPDGEPPLSSVPTPSQTIGPFFHDALLDGNYSELVSSDHPEAITIRGTIYDGAGEVVPDAMVEIWQADTAGRHCSSTGERGDLEAGFSGVGRPGTD